MKKKKEQCKKVKNNFLKERIPLCATKLFMNLKQTYKLPGKEKNIDSNK